MIEQLDPIEKLQLCLQGLFQQMILTEAAKGVIQLKGVSEKWVGDPGLLLWFEKAPGPYLIEIAYAGCSSRPRSREKSFVGTFRVSCYPAGFDASDHTTHSHKDAHALSSDPLFDSTGTPTLEGLLKIPDVLFQTGFICVEISGDNLLHFCSCAPDEFPRISENSVMLSHDAIKHCLKRECRTPWYMTWFILDKLILAFCHINRSKPKHIVLYPPKEARVRHEQRHGQYVLRGSTSLARDAVVSLPCSAHVAAHGHGKVIRTEHDVKNIEWINGQWWHAAHVHVVPNGGASFCAHD